ncbi:MAG: excinuclease ABC subunit UvrC [Desulfofustis sp.]|nr:excinuclease ABC subunit UvrC [Desulfofustis sp.]
MLDQSFLSSVPHAPGVYLMLDRSSTVLYVGKAKDLFKRLSSYIRFKGSAHNKTAVMLSKVHKVDLVLTNTEKEALILEASLIKRHRPRYNVILRDDKSYPLIKVTVQEEWPRVFMTRRKKNDKARYFGPYASSSSMWTTLNLLQTLFPLRRCKGTKLKPRKRPCLNFQMNRCLAPCCGKIDNEPYRAMVDKAILFLEGRNRHLLQGLEKDMKQASAKLDFEKAATLRDQIGGLKRTLEKQVVVTQSKEDRDVYGFARSDASVSVILLYVREGVVRGTRMFFMEDTYGDDQAIMSQIVKQVYDERSLPPQLVLLPFEIEDQLLLGERLSELTGRKTALSVPSRGDRKDLIAMANANARQRFDEIDKKRASWEALGMDLQKRLNLTRLPHHIECVDISNISGTNAVGSLVRYEHGNPQKNGYRRYKIKQVQGPDDYAMMREVLIRRFSDSNPQSAFPEMLLVDGGKGQLSVAESILKEKDLLADIDLIGIAKERQDEGEKLYKLGRKNPIILPPHNPVLLYLMRIRDESHRFGVSFHRSLRNKQTLASILDTIPGVGPARKKQLLKQIGSLKNISQAPVTDLMAVDGIGPELAQQIHNHFHDEPTPR